MRCQNASWIYTPRSDQVRERLQAYMIKLFETPTGFHLHRLGSMALPELEAVSTLTLRYPIRGLEALAVTWEYRPSLLPTLEQINVR